MPTRFVMVQDGRGSHPYIFHTHKGNYELAPVPGKGIWQLHHYLFEHDPTPRLLGTWGRSKRRHLLLRDAFVRVLEDTYHADA